MIAVQLCVILESEPGPVLADMRPGELRHLCRLLLEWQAAIVGEYSQRKMEDRK